MPRPTTFENTLRVPPGAFRVRSQLAVGAVLAVSLIALRLAGLQLPSRLA